MAHVFSGSFEEAGWVGECGTLEEAAFAYFNAFKAHVNVGFFRGAELADPLFYSLVILEREFSRPTYGPTSRKMIEELIRLLRARDLDGLSSTYQTLFGRIVEPGKDLQRVYAAMQGYFRG